MLCDVLSMKVFFLFLAQVPFCEYSLFQGAQNLILVPKIQVAAVGEIFNGNCELSELIFVLLENTARAFRQ